MEMIEVSANRRGCHPIYIHLGEPGVTLLVGDNGSGKTTLLSDVEKRSRSHRTAVLPQEFRVPSLSTVSTLLALFHRRSAMSEEEILDVVSLRDDRQKRVKELSGGMKRRLGVALCLAQGADTLLLDEPCAGLDPTQREHLAAAVAVVGNKTSVLLSTHHVAEFAPVAQRIVVLSAGKAVFDGGPGEFASFAPTGDVQAAYREVVHGGGATA